MVLIDEFESQFRRAAKEHFKFESIGWEKILIVVEKPEVLEGHVNQLSANMLGSKFAASPKVEVFSLLPQEPVTEFIKRIKEIEPSLIITHRHLFHLSPQQIQSLGIHIDVITQSTDIPVLLIPETDSCESHDIPTTFKKVIVLSDHLPKDSHLISYGISVAAENAELILVDMEDRLAFDRFIEIVSKIPEIDTELAREKVKEQLFKEAEEFQDDCLATLVELNLPLTLKKEVRFGSTVADFRELVSAHNADLIVMNTKDHEQLAMHGLAYPLAVEFTDIPLVML